MLIIQRRRMAKCLMFELQAFNEYCKAMKNLNIYQIFCNQNDIFSYYQVKNE